MATVADSLVSSSARKMAIRKRTDLQARKQHYLGRTYWVVKDPVGLHYFRFQQEEYAVLEWLDGQTSLDEIKTRFEATFPPQKITLEELQNFIGMLHKSGLILSAMPGQGEELLKRRKEVGRKKMMGALANVLCIRFKGFDPERFLTWLAPKTGWLFHPLAVAAWALLALAALTLVGVQFNNFRSKLPEFGQFFTMHNAFWLAVVLGLTKVFHELGHGLSCKHFGGECHELGFMLLVLTPCLFCNVSDSWMLPSKWQRAAIGAAGMYVEILLASIATFVWWFTEPGVINSLALNTMFLASVSTVIFNGNPLLRYDGYYILSDLMEIPNLRQKATQVMSRKMGEWFLGMEFPPDPFLPERNQGFFIFYTIAAVVYRWFVMISILLFLYKVWEPYRLEIIGQILGLATLYGLFVYPIYQVGKFFYVPGRWEKVKMPRMYASLAGVVALVAAILFVPLPYAVITSLEIQPRDAKSVYVSVAGQLESLLVKPGQTVAAGQVLARLRSVDLELAVKELQLKRDGYRKQLQSLEHQRFRDPKAGAEIAPIRDALAAVEHQLIQKEKDLADLTLVAPAAGVVFPPSLVEPRGKEEIELPVWSGTPLETSNIGALLEAGSLFCQIGQPKQMEASMVIDQADMDFVREGQTVDVKVYNLPHETLRSKIVEIAQIDLKVAPHRLSAKAGGEVATIQDRGSGMERPLSTSYQARVPLDDEEGVLQIGLRGRGKVHTAPQSLGARMWRFITHTFNFRM